MFLFTSYEISALNSIKLIFTLLNVIYDITDKTILLSFDVIGLFPRIPRDGVVNYEQTF